MAAFWKLILSIVTAIFKGKAEGTIKGKFEVQEKSNEQVEVETDDDKYDELDKYERM